jgi:hypothetical protein
LEHEDKADDSKVVQLQRRLMEKGKEAAQWKRLAKALEAEVEEGKLQLQRRLMEKSKEAAQWKRQAKASVAVAEPEVDESQVLLQRRLMEKSKEAAQWKRQAKALKSELEVEIQRPDAPYASPERSIPAHEDTHAHQRHYTGTATPLYADEFDDAYSGFDEGPAILEYPTQMQSPWEQQAHGWQAPEPQQWPPQQVPYANIQPQRPFQDQHEAAILRLQANSNRNSAPSGGPSPPHDFYQKYRKPKQAARQQSNNRGPQQQSMDSWLHQ